MAVGHQYIRRIQCVTDDSQKGNQIHGKMILVIIGLIIIFSSFIGFIVGVFVLVKELRKTRQLMNEYKKHNKEVDKVIEDILK